ncbi:hypothetical protein [Inediibacterium massiliense]|uniref:hypothetical protein n=1 Tax=Inediibacterium massiliense TaxID=1658111 RepID=UPI0006B41E70|nr:hypothetical protein [Inediibacterium massiliense]
MRVNINAEITKMLKCDKFDIDDFEIYESENKIIIKYAYSDLDYIFRFYIPNQRTEIIDKTSVNFGLGQKVKKVYLFEGELTPGKYANSESFECNNFKEVKYELNLWKDYLFEELNKPKINLNNDDTNNNENRIHELDLENIEKQIDENIPNEMFSNEEIEALNNKLNEVQSKFEKELNSLISDQEKLQEELNKVKEDFQKLKTASIIMTKRNWCKKYTRKIKEFFSDEQKRATAFKVLKGGNILFKQLGMEIPMLEESIETIEEISDSLD